MSSQKFSIDLKKAAMLELEFLKQFVQSQKRLQDQNVLKASLYRYEKLWLPFLHKSSRNFLTDLDFSPPIDVHWIWMAHMLSPRDYQVANHFIAIVAKARTFYHY
jgi:hypothetical protein